jgi:hypothetical protein
VLERAQLQELVALYRSLQVLLEVQVVVRLVVLSASVLVQALEVAVAQ